MAKGKKSPVLESIYDIQEMHIKWMHVMPDGWRGMDSVEPISVVGITVFNGKAWIDLGNTFNTLLEAYEFIAKLQKSIDLKKKQETAAQETEASANAENFHSPPLPPIPF